MVTCLTSFVTGVRVLFVVRAVAGAARGWYRKEGNLRTFTSIDPVPIEFTWHFDAFRILKILNFPLSASFSIFQHLSASFSCASCPFLIFPPFHQAMAWARHCGCSTGTLAGMPSDTKGYHLRRLSVTFTEFTGLLVYPPKGTPFAT